MEMRKTWKSQKKRKFGKRNNNKNGRNHEMAAKITYFPKAIVSHKSLACEFCLEIFGNEFSVLGPGLWHKHEHQHQNTTTTTPTPTIVIDDYNSDNQNYRNNSQSNDDDGRARGEPRRKQRSKKEHTQSV